MLGGSERIEKEWAVTIILCVAMSNPFIGSKVSIISSANVRYEGILFFINPSEKQVTVSQGWCPYIRFVLIY